MKFVCLLTSCIISLQSASASMLDTTFDIGTGAEGLVEQVLQLPDGRILICGNFSSFNGQDRAYIARLKSDGTIDTSFRAHPGYWIRHMELQPDGKIVIGGYFTTVEGTPRNLIARLNSDGSLDPSFDPGTGAEDIIAGGIDGNQTPFVFWMQVQDDGKILITGNFRNYNGESRTGIARLNSDGSLDKTFQVGQGFDSWGRVIKIASNGQIYVGGWFTSYNGQNANRLVRLNPDGTMDTSFHAFYGDKTAVYSIVELPDGRLITSGDSLNPDGLFKQNIVRLNQDGSVDPSWKGSTNDKTESLLLLQDGKLIVGGYFGVLSGEERHNLGRLNADGSIDPGFVAGLDNFVWTVTPATTGKILISGGFNTVEGASRRGVARLNLPEGETTVPPAPTLLNPRTNKGKFMVTVRTSPGFSYTLQSKRLDRTQAGWTNLVSIKATLSSLDLEDPTPGTQTFYRVLAQ